MSEQMAGGNALQRLEQAVARMESAVRRQQPLTGVSDELASLRIRHEQLQAAAHEALGRIDRLLGGAS